MKCDGPLKFVDKSDRDITRLVDFLPRRLTALSRSSNGSSDGVTTNLSIAHPVIHSGELFERLLSAVTYLDKFD